MKRQLLCILLLICMLSSMMIACDKKEELTADEAYSVVLEDLKISKNDLPEPHIHTGTYGNVSCYNIYITLSGESFLYVVSVYGDILSKGPAEHSH